MGGKRARLADVAAHVGVSISTVSRALRGDSRISEKTRRLVVQEAERLGYSTSRMRRPTLQAEEGPKRSVIVVMPTVGVDAFYGAIALEISQAGRERGFAVHMLTIANEAGFVQHLRANEGNHDACVVCTWDSITDEDVTAIERSRIPVVLVNRHTYGRSYAVTHDDFAAGVQAAKYLISLGHRRIAHLAGPPQSTSVSERAAGFRTALERAGLYDPELFVPPVQGNHLDWAAKAMRFLFSREQPPTAVWAFNDGVAANVLMAAKTDGLKVPGDLSVMGFDNLPHSESIGLTTFAFRSRELGKQVVTLLSSIFAGDTDGPVRICVPPKLVIRETTGPPHHSE